MSFFKNSFNLAVSALLTQSKRRGFTPILRQAQDRVKARSAFTLIEMLIVIAVIGILASVVLVGLGPIQRQARDSRRISALRQVQTALELYFTRNGQYPDTQAWPELQAALKGAGIGVTNVPNDPRTNSNYFYGSDNISYVVGATFEDNGNSALKNDVDGTIYGVDCGLAGSDDTVYCVQL
ncbi:MAG: type II secretion system protein [Patescibacteria group bacterium]